MCSGDGPGPGAYVNDDALAWVRADNRVRRRCALTTDYPEMPAGTERRQCELCEQPVLYTLAQKPAPDGEIIYCRLCAEIWQMLCKVAGIRTRTIEPEAATP